MDVAIRGTPATTVAKHKEFETGERCKHVVIYDMMGRVLAVSLPNEITTVASILERHRSTLPAAPVFILATTEHGEQRRSVEHLSVHLK